MSAEEPRSCSYVRTDGSQCTHPAEGEGELCYWHDPHISKETPEVREKLEELKAEGESLEGFVLRYADLEGIRLHSAEGVDLSHSVLFRARLKGAKMWNVNLQGSDMMKADLTGTNLNEANLENASLLGASLEGTKLERVIWGEQAIQEQMARGAEEEGDHEKALVNFASLRQHGPFRPGWAVLPKGNDHAAQDAAEVVFAENLVQTGRSVLRLWRDAAAGHRLFPAACFRLCRWLFRSGGQRTGRQDRLRSRDRCGGQYQTLSQLRLLQYRDLYHAGIR